MTPGSSRDNFFFAKASEISAKNIIFNKLKKNFKWPPDLPRILIHPRNLPWIRGSEGCSGGGSKAGSGT